MNDGAGVAFVGAPVGAPPPPEPAAEHAMVPSSTAVARAKGTRRMALTS
jgi:hypothetical protein